MSVDITRRALLGALSPAIGIAAQNLPTFSFQVKQSSGKRPKLPPVAGEFVRLTDPITENTIVRLTSLGSANVLPWARNRFVSVKERILLFSSDRRGHLAPYQVDLRTGALKQIAETSQLNPRSVCFDKQEKLVRYLDGDALFEVSLNRGTPRRIGEGYSAFSSASDGSLYAIAGGKLVRNNSAGSRVLAEGVSDMWPQPNGAGCLYARAQSGSCELKYVAVDAASTRESEVLVNGAISDPVWDADGQSILFLRDVTLPNGTVISEIHGKALSGGNEYLVAGTSQFACFAPNSEGTVFVGASRSKAQPNVVLLLRSPHREMTLCEHHSSRPKGVAPVFSPDNRRIYFESDREGKPAIYSVNVELLVEPPAV